MRRSRTLDASGAGAWALALDDGDPADILVEQCTFLPSGGPCWHEEGHAVLVMRGRSGI